MLTPPEVYVIFGGHLEIGFVAPRDVSLPNAFVLLHGSDASGSMVEVTSMGLPLSRHSGSLSVECGVIDFTGRFFLSMYMYLNGPVLTSVEFRAIWPPVFLRIPQSHLSRTTSVTMAIDSQTKCNSKLHHNILKFKVLFTPFRSHDDATDFSAKSIGLDEVTVVYIEIAGSVNRMNVTFPCSLFDMEGSYQIMLTSSSGTLVSLSNVMLTTYDAAYSLSSDHSNLLFCTHGSLLEIVYFRTACFLDTDSVVVYALKPVFDKSSAVRMDRIRMSEMPVENTRTNVEFNCSLFSTEAIGYCFVYVTVTRLVSRVEQAELCLPMRPDDVLLSDITWTRWTHWTQCSTTCGNGRRSRYRVCQGRAPTADGKDCPGSSSQTVSCWRTCPGLLPNSPLKEVDLSDTCHCGCSRTTISGQIYATGRCHGLATWTIKSAEGRRVTLTFRFFDISYQQQWVKVRDGPGDEDELLFFSHDVGSDRASPLRNVTTSGNVMRVDLMTAVPFMSYPLHQQQFPMKASMMIHVQGFVASYASSSVVTEMVSQPSTSGREDTPLILNTVTILGIVLCTLVVAVVMILVVVQRLVCRRNDKYAPASVDNSVNQGLMSSTTSSNVSTNRNHSRRGHCEYSARSLLPTDCVCDGLAYGGHTKGCAVNVLPIASGSLPKKSPYHSPGCSRNRTNGEANQGPKHVSALCGKSYQHRSRLSDSYGISPDAFGKPVDAANSLHCSMQKINSRLSSKENPNPFIPQLESWLYYQRAAPLPSPSCFNSLTSRHVMPKPKGHRRPTRESPVQGTIPGHRNDVTASSLKTCNSMVPATTTTSLPSGSNPVLCKGTNHVTGVSGGQSEADGAADREKLRRFIADEGCLCPTDRAPLTVIIGRGNNETGHDDSTEETVPTGKCIIQETPSCTGGVT